MPDVPPPDELPSEPRSSSRSCRELPEPVRRYYERERPIELRPVEFERYLGEKLEDGRFNIWIRATGPLPDDPAIHQCVLAYASDMTLLDTALSPHGRTRVRPRHHGREPRPRAVVPPPVPRRRMAALRAGQPERRTARAASRAA